MPPNFVSMFNHLFFNSFIMKNTFYITILTLLFTSCIGDDIILDAVDETLKITAQATSIAAGETFQFEARFTNNIGEIEENRVTWRSSDEAILTIDPDGLATAISKGNVTIYAEATLASGDILQEEMLVEVSEVTTVIETPTNRTGVIATTTFYDLAGDFSISEVNGNLLLEIADNYEASDALPGLYVYLTNNPNSINDAFEIGKVEIFEGAHSYEIEGVAITDYDYILYFCKPFRVKVGDGKIN